MNRHYFYVGPFFLLLMSLATGARAGMFDFMKIYLFSEIGGVVTMDGKPVAGAELERIIDFGKERITDKTITDEKGQFHFKSITSHTLKKFYEDPSIFQKINILYRGKKYLGWEHMKINYDNNGETDDHKTLTNLKCKLNSKPIENDQLTGPITGVCVWKKK